MSGDVNSENLLAIQLRLVMPEPDDLDQVKRLLSAGNDVFESSRVDPVPIHYVTWRHSAGDDSEWEPDFWGNHFQTLIERLGGADEFNALVSRLRPNPGTLLIMPRADFYPDQIEVPGGSYDSDRSSVVLPAKIVKLAALAGLEVCVRYCVSKH
jgi:hypothetical protein